MAKKQILKNRISFVNGSYKLTYFVNVDGIKKEIGSFESENLAEIVACRELLANLPSLASKLEALENLKSWFENQLTKLEKRIKNSKTQSKAKKEDKEDKDKVLRDFLAKLGK